MKVSGRRTDNQPEAVRTSVDLTTPRAVPSTWSCVVEERIPNPGARASTFEAAAGRAASSARVGGVNNIAVGCLAGKWLENAEFVVLFVVAFDFENFVEVRLAPDFKMNAAAGQIHVAIGLDAGLLTQVLGY